ncbi:30S ribosomal protein S13 [Candidatus Woesearchaeota archaeon]|jgi:small subunit ribosomal protein S13|nr:30S ribosomal protein S13 [Candidatus Woesearchaeota archaeon]MDP6648150.1 30S ribosomal protein S13 [Candidatus Woesearchaeota archaeon]|tara:strand:+ start:100266 stop:100751 length:486 start_codon:yes stop_codon:yes gene_type:complete
MAEEQKQELKYFVRIANTDLNGNKPIFQSLTKIKGISFMFSNAICRTAGIETTKKTGYLTDNEAAKIDDIIKDPLKFKLPSWLLNRKRDPENNLDKHLIGPTLTFTQDNDIKMMKKIKSYKGVRHSFGQPVRGQRTRSNFRRNKGKVLGVKRKEGAKAGRP